MGEISTYSSGQIFIPKSKTEEALKVFHATIGVDFDKIRKDLEEEFKKDGDGDPTTFDSRLSDVVSDHCYGAGWYYETDDDGNIITFTCEEIGNWDKIHPSDLLKKLAPFIEKGKLVFHHKQDGYPDEHYSTFAFKDGEMFSLENEEYLVCWGDEENVQTLFNHCVYSLINHHGVSLSDLQKKLTVCAGVRTQIVRSCT